MVRNRIDANFDWLTLDTPQEEETFGKTGLVVECVFDFVFDTLFLLVLIFHSGTVQSGFLLLDIQRVKRVLGGEREAGSRCEFEVTS